MNGVEEGSHYGVEDQPGLDQCNLRWETDTGT